MDIGTQERNDDGGKSKVLNQNDSKLSDEENLEESTSVDKVQEGFYTAESWNPPATYQQIQFSTEIADICRALFLCKLPDDFHTTLITVGGIHTVEQLSLMSWTKWDTLAK